MDVTLGCVLRDAVIRHGPAIGVFWSGKHVAIAIDGHRARVEQTRDAVAQTQLNHVYGSLEVGADVGQRVAERPYERYLPGDLADGVEPGGKALLQFWRTRHVCLHVPCARRHVLELPRRFV